MQVFPESCLYLVLQLLVSLQGCLKRICGIRVSNRFDQISGLINFLRFGSNELQSVELTMFEFINLGRLSIIAID